MATAPFQPDSSSQRERRRDVRASFLPNRRPLLQLSDGAFPVLDISLRGLRIRHFNPVRPSFGSRIEGTLQFPDHRPPVPVQGIIVRVQTADVAIMCDEGTLPAGWILEEAAHARAGYGTLRNPGRE